MSATLSQWARERDIAACERRAALDEIEAMMTFNLSAEHQRKEIARIIKECKERIDSKICR